MKEYKPALSLVELQEENQRLKSLLIEATRPLISQGLSTSPGGVNLEDVQKELDRSQSPVSGQSDSNAQVQRSSGRKKQKAPRARSRSKSREEKRAKEKEMKRKAHEDLVREAHWQGRMDGRHGNEKPVPVSDKQSLRLRQKHEKKARERNPAMHALPATPKEAELREVLVTGVRPFLPGALEMDKTLSEDRANSPPGRSRSKSPTALQRAREEYKAGSTVTRDRPNSKDSGTVSRPGSRSKSSRPASGSLSARSSRRKQQRATSPSPSPTTTLPRIAINTDTDGPHGGMDMSVQSPGAACVSRTTSAGVLMDSSSVFERSREEVGPLTQPTPGATGAGVKGSSKADRSQLPAYTPPEPQSTDLFPVSSQLYVGLQGTVGHRPMVLTLLASKKPLWKVSGAQAFDPHLHLAAFPPPPNKIVVNLFDVGTINPAAGDKHHPQQASFVINVREYTALLYDMVDRYRKKEEQEREIALKQRDSVTQEVAVPAYSGAVSQVFHPSSLEWWVQHLHRVVIVRAKGNGSLMVRISKAAIEKLVAVKVHNHLDLPGPPPAGGAASRVALVDPSHTISHWWEHRPGPPAAMLSHSASEGALYEVTTAGLAPTPPAGSTLSQHEITEIIARDAPYGVGMFSGASSSTTDSEKQRPSSRDSALPQPAAGDGDPLLSIAPIWEESSVLSLDNSTHNSQEGSPLHDKPTGPSGSVLGVSSTVDSKKGKGKNKSSKSSRSRSPTRAAPQDGDSVLERSPKSVLPIPETYKPMPGRSKAPGFFGNETQHSSGKEFAAVAWNDNTDFDRSAVENTVLPGMERTEAKPVLFKDDRGPANEEKVRSRSPGKKNTASDLDGETASKKFAPAVKPDTAARTAIISARNAVSSSTKFRTRKLTDTEAGLFRSPFAMPLVTEKIRREAA